MLQAYEVMIENGQIKWLKEQPNIRSGRAIITFVEEYFLTTDNIDLDNDNEPSLESLGGSEPQAQTIPRRRYDI
jgi:hypothetical protein